MVVLNGFFDIFTYCIYHLTNNHGIILSTSLHILGIFYSILNIYIYRLAYHHDYICIIIIFHIFHIIESNDIEAYFLYRIYMFILFIKICKVHLALHYEDNGITYHVYIYLSGNYDIPHFYCV